MTIDQNFYIVLRDVKAFVQEHVLTERGTTFLEQAVNLERQAYMYSNRRCSVCFEDEVVYELDYYLKILQIIKTRIHRNMGMDPSCELCTSYDFRSGSPSIIYDNQYTGMMKAFIFISMAIAGITQFIRGQLDGELSAWSQLGFIAGALVSIVYFGGTKQYSFIIPQVGSLILASFQLVAIARHHEGENLFDRW